MSTVAESIAEDITKVALLAVASWLINTLNDQECSEDNLQITFDTLESVFELMELEQEVIPQALAMGW